MRMDCNDEVWDMGLSESRYGAKQAGAGNVSNEARPFGV